jgi:hypothetical protein
VIDQSEEQGPNLLELIISVQEVKLQLAITISVAKLVGRLHLVARHTSPDEGLVTSVTSMSQALYMFLPMLPPPRAMVLDGHPCSKAQLALSNLDALFLAERVLACGTA